STGSRADAMARVIPDLSFMRVSALPAPASAYTGQVRQSPDGLFWSDGAEWRRVDAAAEGVPSPPTGATGMVYGVDALGVPGWVPRREYVGATLWPTTDTNKGTTEPTFGYSNIIFGDAEEYGLPFFKYDGTAAERERLTVPEDGLYVVSFCVAFPAAQVNQTNRARVFLNGDPI